MDDWELHPPENNSDDLAGVGHWETVYRTADAPNNRWQPGQYWERCLEHLLDREIRRNRPASVLEVGCGNSCWLPYLARLDGVATVAGIDYCEQGCELARQRLLVEGAQGTVYCRDIFDAKLEEVGQYDLVYSLGVVEHFVDLAGVIAALVRFVRPGGILLTEIPNLNSIHGLLCYLYQPTLYARHQRTSPGQLATAYRRSELEGVRTGYLGHPAMCIVAPGVEPRWPSLDRFVCPRMRGLRHRLERLLRSSRSFKGLPGFAPYLYCVGRKPY